MPKSTPAIKLNNVKKFGGDWVTIQMFGEIFDEAMAESKRFQVKKNKILFSL